MNSSSIEKAVPNARLPLRVQPRREPTSGAFFWLSAFFVVYCARPEDWIPGLAYIPLAKISAIFALLGLMMSAGRSKRSFRDLPREAKYFVGMVGALFVAAVVSPVWKGGAFFKTLDFAKAPVAWVLTFLVITNLDRLKKIIFIQSASVAAITVVSLVKGRSSPRLEGVIGGIYSNPNDLAFAIVLSLPFCFAFLLNTRSIPRKSVWMGAMLAMCTALFMTGSRAGFIDLVVTGVVCVWLFGIKGKRAHLVATAAIVALIVGLTAGARVKDRFFAISGKNLDTGIEVSAHGSYEQRWQLMVDSVEAVARYPFGLGMGNFVSYNGTWREVHVAYLQIAAEGGIIAFVLYLLFFAHGFGNLRQLRRVHSPDPEIELFSGALYATLTGFVVGAFFAPEAYQYFPYFAEAYTAVLLVIAREKPEGPSSDLPQRPQRFSKPNLRTARLARLRGAADVRTSAGKPVLRHRS
jgi:O-antigen ligase